jgi:hypothetical protein
LKIREHVDVASLVAMLVTLILFVAALFSKGLTHDLLLEAGVFLVSVKLMLMSHKNSVAAQKLYQELCAIRALVQPRDGTPGSGPAAHVPPRDAGSAPQLPRAN